MRWLAFALALLASPALAEVYAEPFVMVGQTDLDGQSAVDDPAPNSLGVVSTNDWPVFVPLGKKLVIHGMNLEAQPIRTPGWRPNFDPPEKQFLPWSRTGLVLWVSEFESTIPTNAMTLDTCLGRFVTIHCPMYYEIPAGYWLHMRILNPLQGSQVHGWHVWGEWADVP